MKKFDKIIFHFQGQALIGCHNKGDLKAIFLADAPDIKFNIVPDIKKAFIEQYKKQNIDILN